MKTKYDEMGKVMCINNKDEVLNSCRTMLLDVIESYEVKEVN